MLMNFIFLGVLLIMTAFAISMSMPFDASWGKRDRAIIVLLAAGSIIASFGIVGSIIQPILKAMQ